MEQETGSQKKQTVSGYSYEELLERLKSGEVVAPKTEEEYNAMFK